MKNRKLLIIAFALCAVGGVHYLLQAYDYSIPVLRHYLDDLLIVPITGTLALWVQRKWIVRHENFRFTGLSVAMLCVYYAIAFEWIIPAFHSSFTADYADVIAYATGGLLFYVYINKAVPNVCVSNQ